MSSKNYSIIAVIGFLVTGAMLAISSRQLVINHAALNYSKAFTGERMFSEALTEAGFRTRERLGDESIGTWYNSGMSKFSQAREVEPDPMVVDLVVLTKFGEILQAKLIKAGVRGEGGLKVTYNDCGKDAKFRFYYSIRGREGEIDIFKIGNWFFFTQSETTNIRNF